MNSIFEYVYASVTLLVELLGVIYLSLHLFAMLRPYNELGRT
jgi:hypothetical protein